MAFSDCSNCGNTPCICGYGYSDWNKDEIDELILKLQLVLTLKAEIPQLKKEELLERLNRNEYIRFSKKQGGFSRL